MKAEGDGTRGKDEGEGRWLMGGLHTTKKFNRDAMVGLFKQIWRLSKDFEVNLLEENLFLDRDRVLEGSPWTFDKQVLLLEDYVCDQPNEDYEFANFQIWIRIYGLPVSYLKKEIGIQIGNMIGHTQEVDSSFEHGGNAKYLRLRIAMRIDQPIRRAVILTDPKGKRQIKGKVKYERLPTFCHWCGLLGHIDKDCKDSDESDNEGKSQPYGDWL